MAAGDLALVLHAHLPYVRSSEPGSLEEDWYFQALQECYLPLLGVLEAAAADRRQRPRLTLGLSPTLLSLLADPQLNGRFLAWIAVRQELLLQAPKNQAAVLASKNLSGKSSKIITNKATGRDAVTYYKVQKGDSLYLIAKRFKVDLTQLKRWNPKATSALKLGQTLTIKKAP